MKKILKAEGWSDAQAVEIMERHEQLTELGHTLGNFDKIASSIISSQKMGNLEFELDALRDAGLHRKELSHLIANCALFQLTPTEALEAFNEGYQEKIFSAEGAAKIVAAGRLADELENWHRNQKAGRTFEEILDTGHVVWNEN